MSNLFKAPAWILRSSRVVLIFIATAFLSFFMPWHQFSSGEGQVIGLDPNERFQEIHAPISGFVKTWHVREGSIVKKGQTLVSLSDIDTDLSSRLAIETEAAERSLKAAELALSTSRINLARQEKLFRDGLAARKDWEKERIEVSKYEMEVAKARAVLVKAQSGAARQATQDIIAPRDGQIVRVRAGEGAQVVKTGDPLLILAPTTEKLAAEIWISGHDVGLIKLGSPARLEFAGWPAVQMPGWPSLAIGTFKGKVTLIDTLASKDGKFRVLIVPDEPWPSDNFLRQGVRAAGFIVMDRVTVGWELWRHFNGIPLNNSEMSDEIQHLLGAKKDL